MGPMFGIGAIFWLIFVFFVIGSFVALPFIWYHAGAISRKFDKTNQLLASIMKRLPSDESTDKE